MLEHGEVGSREAEANDEAGVIEGVAEDLIAGLDEGGQDADVELEAAREQYSVLGAGQSRQSGLDGTMFREITTDKA